VLSLNKSEDAYPSGVPIFYEGVSKNFWTSRLERELQMVQLSAARCSCIAILWVSLVRFAAITVCVVSQQVFIIVVIYFLINSDRKLLGTPTYKCILLPFSHVSFHSMFINWSYKSVAYKLVNGPRVIKLLRSIALGFAMSKDVSYKSCRSYWDL
jgi:hypothetical protein